MKRNNGHRGKFKDKIYDQSALSMHIKDKHTELDFSNKLNNYSFGIVKHISPDKLDRCEDYYIYETCADSQGLNRYKVAK